MSLNLKRCLLFVPVIFCCMLLNAQGIKTDIEKKLNITFHQKGFGASDEAYTNNNYETIYKNTRITIFYVFYADNYESDYWSPERIRELHNNVISTQNFSYLFSTNEEVSKINSNYLVDYFVFGMFENEDLRLVRYFVVFDNLKASIICITSLADMHEIDKDLLLAGYRIKTSTVTSSWDSIHNSDLKLGEDIRKNKVNIKTINEWYSVTNEVKNAMNYK